MSGFMRLQVWREKSATLPEGNEVPLSEAEDAIRHSPEHIEVGPPAWWARYSAPGYMDRTDSVGPCDSPMEAAREAFNLYGDNEPGSPDRKELAQFIWGVRSAEKEMSHDE